MALLVASKILVPEALPPDLVDEVSSGVSPLEAPVVMGTTVGSSTMVLSAPFVLFAFSVWSGNGVSDTTEGWQTLELLPSSA